MQPERYSRVRRFIAEQVWAMLPSAFEAMLEVVELRASGIRLADEERAERIAAARRSRATAAAPGSIAVLPLYGVIAQRMDLFQEVSGGTSTESFAADLRAALADPNVGAVVLDVDSPGGSVFSIEETGDLIATARGGSKPIVAVANSMAASAAYWLASQADELVVTPSGMVGSIGVISQHVDYSAAAEREGVRVTYITAGRRKAEGNQFEPLSDEARSYEQKLVDSYYDAFVRAVSRGRRVAQKAVRSEEWGEGRMVLAERAVELGMANSEGTLQETIDRLAAKQARRRSAAAARARLNLAEVAG